MRILGISCFYHDSAAALVIDGKIIAAAQEERFTRKKQDERFPHKAVEYCLKEAGIKIDEIDIVAFYDKPFLKFERLLETYLSYAPRGLRSFLASMPGWLKDKFWMSSILKKELGYKGKVIFTTHHESHAASAFYPSRFDSAAFLTVDGVGEWATASFGVGNGNKLEFKGELLFPHSLGLLYSAFTYYAGFKVNSGEYKVMGLAPYGEPKYVNIILDKILDLREDGSFALDMSYFNFAHGLTMTSGKFHDLFGGVPREPESLLTQKEMDLARSIQDVTEIIMLKMAKHVRQTTGEKYLVLAGGVALNCVANGKILKERIFDDIWIQPAAGDAGGALGAALFAWYSYLNNPREPINTYDRQMGTLLGPKFTNEEIRDFLENRKIPYTFVPDESLFDKGAELLAAENIIGWFQGRMEFGPRALGARSIIGDARSPSMQSRMNLKIKFRESFRPFAPSVLLSDVLDYFELNTPSPYMLLTANVIQNRRKQMTSDEEKLWGIEKLNVPRSDIPAVTHIDYSARVQTVDHEGNPRYALLLEAFKRKTGCPVIVNTSYNVRGEPIVCTPEDAYRCFMRTDIDFLIMENFILDKKAQPKADNDESWKNDYVLD